MAIRTCEISGEKVTIRMSDTASEGATAWEIVNALKRSEVLRIPGLENICASTEDEAFRRACERIGTFLASQA
jgi:hypothetical protein